MWIIEYYAEGESHPSDCHPDFFRTRREAVREAGAFMALVDWAVRWTVRKA